MVNVQKKGTKTYRELIFSAINALGVEQNFRSAKKILVKPNLVTLKTASQGVTVDLVLLRHLAWIPMLVF